MPPFGSDCMAATRSNSKNAFGESCSRPAEWKFCEVGSIEALANPVTVASKLNGPGTLSTRALER